MPQILEWKQTRDSVNISKYYIQRYAKVGMYAVSVDKFNSEGR